jgi:hypothetical protein
VGFRRAERRAQTSPDRPRGRFFYRAAAYLTGVSRKLARRPQRLIEAADPDAYETCEPLVLLLDAEGVIVTANDAARQALARITPRTPTLGAGRRYLDVCERLAPGLSRVWAAGALAEISAGLTHNLVWTPPPDATDTGEIRFEAISLSGRAVMVVVHEPCPFPVRPTASQLLHAKDEQRRLIGIELHDSLSQYLVAMSLGVANLRRLSDPRAVKLLEEMAGSVHATLKQVRVLSFLMVPPAIGHGGLGKALDAYARGFARRADLPCQVACDDPPGPIDDEVAELLLRVLQQGLAAVHQPSLISNLGVRLTASAGKLELSVSITAARPEADGAERCRLQAACAVVTDRVAELQGRTEFRVAGAVRTLSAVVPVFERQAAAQTSADPRPAPLAPAATRSVRFGRPVAGARRFA